MAGFIVEATGQLDWAFYIAGGLLAASSLTCGIAYIVQKVEGSADTDRRGAGRRSGGEDKWTSETKEKLTTWPGPKTYTQHLESSQT